MPLPSQYNSVPVKATYVDLQGNPATGTIEFDATVNTINVPAAEIIVMAKTLPIVLDANGSFTLQVPATDDPDVSPTNFLYKVTEKLTGLKGRSYLIEVPLASLPDGINLATMAPPEDPDGPYTYVVDGGGP